MTYQEFLKIKAISAKSVGFNAEKINKKLFPFQRDVVWWGLLKGRAAFFEDCGLGKTAQQLEWASQVVKHTNGKVLILTPLSVASQTLEEAKKFGIDQVKHCSEGSEVECGITVTNYEKLHRFDLSMFQGIALDESSILKSKDGKYRTMLIELAQQIPFRSAWTATPAPNDFVEIGNHAEFLGVMRAPEMLSTFFIHDGGNTSSWRLKCHAVSKFWEWLCSWSVNIRKPSDIGYDDSGFNLPKLTIESVTVDCNCKEAGMLFPMPASSLKERRDVRRSSLVDRAKKCAEIANENNEQWIVWCDLNDESKTLSELICGSVEVTGADCEEKRSKAMLGFTSGEYRVLISKPGICGFGMNWQHAHNMIFCGLSDSYESYYQALRREYRFGQKSDVRVVIVTSNLEGAVVENIKRKQKQSDFMTSEMVKNMSRVSEVNVKMSIKNTELYTPKEDMELPNFL